MGSIVFYFAKTASIYPESRFQAYIQKELFKFGPMKRISWGGNSLPAGDDPCSAENAVAKSLALMISRYSMAYHVIMMRPEAVCGVCRLRSYAAPTAIKGQPRAEFDGCTYHCQLNIKVVAKDSMRKETKREIPQSIFS